MAQDEEKILTDIICCESYVNTDDTEQVSNRMLCILKHEWATSVGHSFATKVKTKYEPKKRFQKFAEEKMDGMETLGN